jgi:hypothetical protein
MEHDFTVVCFLLRGEITRSYQEKQNNHTAIEQLQQRKAKTRSTHRQQLSSFSLNETPLFYGSLTATNGPIKQVFIHSETKMIKEIILSTINRIKNS